MLTRMNKKEPISDLTEHNLQREKDVRSATKRLDEYLVQKFDLNKSTPKISSEKETKLSNENNPEISKTIQNKQEDSNTESENDSKPK